MVRGTVLAQPIVLMQIGLDPYVLQIPIFVTHTRTAAQPSETETTTAPAGPFPNAVSCLPQGALMNATHTNQNGKACQQTDVNGQQSAMQAHEHDESLVGCTATLDRTGSSTSSQTFRQIHTQDT